MSAPYGRPADAAARAERDAQIIRLKREGKSFAEIGRELGISKAGAFRGFWRGLDRIVEPERDAYKAEQLARLELAREAVMDVLTGRHVVVSQGHIVSEIVGETDDGDPIYGDPLEDTGPTLAAVDRLLKIDDQEARLLKLYPKDEMTIDGGLDIRVRGVDTADLGTPAAGSEDAHDENEHLTQ